MSWINNAGTSHLSSHGHVYNFIAFHTHPMKAEKFYLVVQKDKQKILEGQKQTQHHPSSSCGWHGVISHPRSLTALE